MSRHDHTTVSPSVTFSTPNDPAEHPDYDAAFEAELNAHYDAIASDIATEELEAMHRQQQARAAYLALPSTPMTAEEVEAWFHAA